MSKMDRSPLHALKSTIALLKRENLETLITNRHVYGSEQQAVDAFQRARDRLVEINRWDALGPPFPLRVRWTLVDSEGTRLDRLPQKGDYVRMELPPTAALPLRSLGGPDWLVVENFHEDALFVNLRMRPSTDPTAMPSNPAIISHYLTDKALIHISLERHGSELVCSVHGEHEYANSDVPSAGSQQKATRNAALAQLFWGLGRPRFGTTPGERMLESIVGLNRLLWTPFVHRLSTPPPDGERAGRGLLGFLRRVPQPRFRGGFGFNAPRAG